MRTRPGRGPAALGAAVLAAGVLATGALAAGTAVGPVAVARADTAGDARAAAAAAQDARSRAAQAAVRVEALTEAYVAASARTRAGLAALARAYGASAQADASARAARDDLARARAERARRVRALYASGGTSGLAASVLAAGSPEEALWRTGTVRHVLAALARRSEDGVVTAQRDVTSTRARQRGTDAGLQAQVSVLDRLEADAAAAQQALDGAHAVLAGLDEQARRADVAARAAQSLAAAEAAARAARRAATAAVGAAGIPDEYAAAYRASAGTCTGLRWTLLAGVGQVESGHGRDVGPSSAGALGPMQFMPATFSAYAVDGDGDGVLDVQDPQDAVASAANYLCRSGIDGTPAGDRRALLAYNHAQWYVDLVLDAEAGIVAAGAGVTAGPAAPAP